ncbi:Endoribonuclease L-PSP/chorismate mutase-like protein [Immersiella caudata]|uniref:Endoribonuclease L-PSP/chorismate mutase-like protein n=1 Tax=Immersiella caudata TaxID=314043 RepID=A0AA39WC17_9PEZI|nr:Endoribonuclease L-PSP/chorismate mutase-like protein [Immersiella caudata]
MSQIEAIFTEKAPKPLPQFSQAIKYNGIVYCSGSIGLDPATWKVVEGTVRDRTRQALKNLSAVLEEAGSSFRNVVKMNIFLTTMDSFAAMNEAYDEFFTWDSKPCRTCVAVYQLPFGTDVEIECTAFVNN